MWFFLNARSVRATSSGLSSTSMIGPSFTRGGSSLGMVKGERESRAAADGAFRPNPAPVPGEDALDGGQADAVALELVRVVQPLERLEQFVRVGGIETGAVVADEVNRPAALLPGAEFDSRRGVPLRVLEGVAEQVLQRDLQQVAVAVGREVRSDDPLDGSLRIRGGQAVGDFAGDPAEIDPRPAKFR